MLLLQGGCAGAGRVPCAPMGGTLLGRASLALRRWRPRTRCRLQCKEPLPSHAVSCLQVFNCDDLLMNFVAANLTRAEARAAAAAAGEAQRGEGEGSDCGPPAVRLVRPQRRLDLSRLSGVGECMGPRLCAPAAAAALPPWLPYPRPARSNVV